MTDWIRVVVRRGDVRAICQLAGDQSQSSGPSAPSSSGGSGFRPSVRAVIPRGRQTQNYPPRTRTSLPVSWSQRSPYSRGGLDDLHGKPSDTAARFPLGPACRRPYRARPSAIPFIPNPSTYTNTNLKRTVPRPPEPVDDSPKPTKKTPQPRYSRAEPRSLPRIVYPGPRLRH